MEDQVNFLPIAEQLKENIYDRVIKLPDPPISTIYVGDNGYIWAMNVNKKFNWFQKKMIKWCFGFEVKENNNEREQNSI